MPEVEIDALFFQQAADEIEVGLAVLDAVFALGRRRGYQAVIERDRAAVLADDLLENVERRLVLEDAAVGGARQQP